MERVAPSLGRPNTAGKGAQRNPGDGEPSGTSPVPTGFLNCSISFIKQGHDKDQMNISEHLFNIVYHLLHARHYSKLVVLKPGQFLPRDHLAVSGDIFNCHS